MNSGVTQSVSFSGNRFPRGLFQIVKKKEQGPKSIQECSDRSGNVINRKSVKFYRGAILRFFSQLSFFIEKNWCSNRVARKNIGFHWFSLLFHWFSIDFLTVLLISLLTVRKINENPGFSGLNINFFRWKMKVEKKS